jgi:hypothetical protein
VPDSVLDLLVWVLPFLLSLVGMLLTLEPLSQQSQRHKWKWRIGLAVFGGTLSLMTYVQQGRQRAQSTSNIRELREQALRQERESDQRAEDLKKNFDVFVAESLRERRATPIVIPKSPTAEEIAAELDRKLSARLNGANSPNPTEGKPLVQAKPTPTLVPTPIDPPIRRWCRNDHLNECSDEELLERLKPLVTNILAIHEEYSTDTKRLDDIKGGKLNWLRELAGIGGDKDSKWLKGFELARKKASDHFRDCCAETALVYHKELLQRYHEGSDNAELYEWVQSLLRPVGSKEWKKARDDGSKVGDVYFDLHFYQIHLEYVIAVSRIPNRHS